MASILLIEHQALVRDAIRHFLFPQHDVTPVTQSPTLDELRSYDLVILDVETLPRLNQTHEQFASLLAEAKVPAVWMCSPETPVPESGPTRVFVTKPLEAEVFRRAIAELVVEQPGSEARGDEDGEQIIDLTDVIAEEPDEETESPDEETN